VQAACSHPLPPPPLLLLLRSIAAVYQEPDQLPGCLGPMGIDTNSIKFVYAKDTPVSAVTALVMKASKERIFVVFKVCITVCALSLTSKVHVA
jgi:hypothetical protein